MYSEFERRIGQGEFRTVAQAPEGAGQQYTTAAMLCMEKETIKRMREANRAGIGPLLGARTSTEIIGRHPELNSTQKKAADQIFQSREKIVGLDKVAGAGKTMTLAVIREGAEANGYKVEGFAPTSRAVQQLSSAVWRPPRYNSTSRRASSLIAARSGSMCWTRAHSLQPSRRMAS